MSIPDLQDYKVLCGGYSNIRTLVVEHLVAGWIVLGGVSYDQETGYFAQAMGLPKRAKGYHSGIEYDNGVQWLK